MATYARFTPNDSGQRLLPTYYRGCWHVVSRSFLWRYRHSNRLLTGEASSQLKEVYNPKAVFPHAALLRHAFAHCARFPTAASRRSLGRVSVPVWLIILSDQLPIGALVSRYLTNKLMGRGPIPMRKPKLPFPVGLSAGGTSGISPSFLGLSRSSGHVTHVLLTRSRLCPRPKPGSSLHLHVLSTPPAFVLSQDQTLREELLLTYESSSAPHTRMRPYTVAGIGGATGSYFITQPCPLAGHRREAVVSKS